MAILRYTRDKLYSDDVPIFTGNMTGVIFDFGGTVAPKGSLPCNGVEVPIASYPDLFAAIGHTWSYFGGASCGNGYFRVPPQAYGTEGLFTRGTGGVAVGTFQMDQMKAHTHDTYVYTNGTYGGANAKIAPALADATSALVNTSTSAGSGTETRPKSMTVYKCIWY